VSYFHPKNLSKNLSNSFPKRLLLRSVGIMLLLLGLYQLQRLSDTKEPVSNHLSNHLSTHLSNILVPPIVLDPSNGVEPIQFSLPY